MTTFTCVVDGVQYLALRDNGGGFNAGCDGCAGCDDQQLCDELPLDCDTHCVIWVKRTPETEIAHVTYLLEQS